MLRAADAIVVPTLPAPLSQRKLEQLRDFVAVEGWSDLAILPIFSMVDRRRSLHQQVIAEARSRFPSILECGVPYWSETERVSARRAPLPAFSSPHSPAAGIYAVLWKEIEARLGPWSGRATAGISPVCTAWSAKLAGDADGRRLQVRHTSVTAACLVPPSAPGFADRPRCRISLPACGQSEYLPRPVRNIISRCSLHRESCRHDEQDLDRRVPGRA